MRSSVSSRPTQMRMRLRTAGVASSTSVAVNGAGISPPSVPRIRNGLLPIDSLREILGYQPDEADYHPSALHIPPTRSGLVNDPRRPATTATCASHTKYTRAYESAS